MKRTAVNKLINVVSTRMDSRPLQEQIDIYKFLAEVLPQKSDCEHAQHIAWLLAEAERHQIDFHQQLARELQQPDASAPREKPTRLFSIDSERIEFLRQLNGSRRVAVTDWEDEFITNAFKFQTGAVLFSESQRRIIDRLFQKYGGDL